MYGTTQSNFFPFNEALFAEALFAQNTSVVVALTRFFRIASRDDAQRRWGPIPKFAPFPQVKSRRGSEDAIGGGKNTTVDSFQNVKHGTRCE